jgi:two-component sensor histidine kinase
LSDERVIITNEKGIYLFNYSSLRCKLIFPLRNNEVYCCYQDSLTRDVWFGTAKGAYRFNKGKIDTDQTITPLPAQIQVSSISKGLDDNIWFTTMSNGVYYSDFKSMHYTMEDGLKSNEVLYLKKQGKSIYAISSMMGISLIRNGKAQIIHFQDPVSRMRAVYQVNEGPVYISARDVLFTLWNNRIISSVVPSPSEDPCYPVYLDAKQNFYYASQKTNRLYRYDGTGSFYMCPDDKIQRKANTISPIQEKVAYISGTEFFYFTDKGIVHSGIKNGSVYANYDTLYVATPNDMIFTPSGNLVVATNKGVDVVIKGVHHKYLNCPGLPDNVVRRIRYEKGYLWAATNNGLIRLKLDDQDSVKSIVNLNSGNLLIADEVNDVIFSGDDIYAATNKGVSRFNKNSIPVIHPAPVYIQNIQVNGADTVCNGDMVLPYNRNNLSIQYRIISFNNSVYYRYRLIGADKGYMLTKQDIIKYANLEPGHYTFEVFGRVENGTWGSPARLSFTILPPFWKTWMFILAVIFLFLLLLYFVVFKIITTAKKKDTLQRKIIESELKSIRLHMNPHFIYNTLSSLQFYILSNQNDEANEYLGIFSKLVRLIMQYAQLKEITLNEEIDFLKMYVQLEQARFEERFDFEVVVDEALLFSVLIPPLIIQPFIENAIKYGFAGKKTKGHLSLRLEKDGNYLHCIIHDNGIGREKAAEIKKQNISPRESTGIRFTEERLKLLSARYGKRELVKIYDLYNLDNKPSGTKVELFVPLS